MRIYSKFIRLFLTKSWDANRAFNDFFRKTELFSNPKWYTGLSIWETIMLFSFSVYENKMSSGESREISSLNFILLKTLFWIKKLQERSLKYIDLFLFLVYLINTFF